MAGVLVAAVLLTNKREVGESEGNRLRSSIEDRAEDVYAAVRTLQDHPSIDADKIGLVGRSQGGWVVVQAAAQHKVDKATHVFRLVNDPCESWVNVPEQSTSEEPIVVLNEWLAAQGY